jgi:hypothetical protein
MKELTKGTLVMTDMGLAWYDRIENGEHLVNPITWENDHLSPHFNASVATRAQVEAKVKEMGWELYPSERGQFYAKRDSQYIVRSDYSDYFPESKGLIKDFDTASAQLAEAILVARMLNATKD